MATWPMYDEEEIAAVVEVLRTGKVNYWTGHHGRAFEQEFASFVGTEHAVALANGSLALEAALLALSIGPGDEVVVPCHSFVATASSVVRVGAVPVFADVDRDSHNITSSTIAPVLSPRTRAIIVVHLAGWPAEMDPILELARSHDLRVIEDCAQAHGAVYRGRRAGSLGDIAAWSFCQDKIISTAGEGGMITTDSRELWKRAWALKDHGRSYELAHAPRQSVGFQWLVDSFGTNWRMTEIQAVVGRLQLRKLPEWNRIRRANAELLHRRLSGLPGLRLVTPPPHVVHAYYRYYLEVVPEELRPGWDRDHILAELTARGYSASVGVCPEIYREKAFVDAGYTPGKRLPVASRLGETSLCLPVDPTLTEKALHSLADCLEEILQQAAV